MGLGHSPSIVRDGLVLYLDAANSKSYPGSGTNWIDLTGNGNNGTLLNGVAYNSNKKGYFDFDGSDDRVTIANTSYWNNNVFGTATNFTIMCWAKIDSFFNWTCLIQKNGGAGFYSESQGASLWINSSGIQAVFANGEPNNPTGFGFILSYSTTNTTDWFHITFTGDGTTGRFYINGNLHNSGSLSSRTRSVISSNNPVVLGARAQTVVYNGLMNLPMFYTRGLSTEEVKQNFEATRGRFGV